MKKIYAIILSAVLALGATSCDISEVFSGEWLDINTNPNYVSEASMNLLLPSAHLNMVTKVGYDLGLYGSFWSHYVVQCSTTNQYYTVMTNNVTNESFTAPWQYLYTRVLPPLHEVIEKAEAAEDASNFLLEARTTLVYALYLLTSLYDQVAYTEGYLTPSQTPKFDSGKDIQAEMIRLLEEIRSMDAGQVAADEVLNTSVSSDMFLAGDTDAWFKFANTLYLKVLMRDFSANRSKIEALLSEGDFLDESDVAFANFSDAADKSSPFYESDRRKLNTADNIRCCSDIFKVLDASDPRLYYYYENHPNGTVNGSSYGMVGDPKETSRLALSATDPVYIGTIDEALFLQAEAYARLNNAAKAQAAYEDAVAAAFERAAAFNDGVAKADVDDFLAGPYAFTSGSVEQMVEQIINQKWASNVRCMPFEAWFDINRTGYPAFGKVLTEYRGVASGYPVRFINPKNSTDFNPNAPAPVPVSEKMWWHK